jgi:hypothetical protein
MRFQKKLKDAQLEQVKAAIQLVFQKIVTHSFSGDNSHVLSNKIDP